LQIHDKNSKVVKNEKKLKEAKKICPLNENLLVEQTIDFLFFKNLN
jgi:hypothetical protein